MITLIIGPMGAGKTTYMISCINDKCYMHGNKKILSFMIFKKSIDTRDNDDNRVFTHSKLSSPATMVTSANDILKYSDKYEIFGIEEAHFFENITYVAKKLENMGKYVYITMLSSDYRMMPFKNGYDLYPHSIIKQKQGYCYKCGRSTIYTSMIDNSNQKGEIIISAGMEKFQPTCKYHHPYFKCK